MTDVNLNGKLVGTVANGNDFIESIVDSRRRGNLTNNINVRYDENSFNGARFFGRLSALNDKVTIDVGHNTLAAKAVLNAFEGRKMTLIYNSLKDKEYHGILKILKPIIEDVLIIDIGGERAVARDQLEESLIKLSIPYSAFHELEENKNYLVFGSFLVVEAFLKVFNEAWWS